MRLIWIVPALPLLGAILLAAGRRLPERLVGIVGSLTVGLSALAASVLAWLFVAGGLRAYTATLWPWLDLGGEGAGAAISLSVDALSIVMILVVTIVGFLIHLFSIRHMSGEEGYHRFFSYMNLFVAFMLILVLADNFLLLYLGWEGVGLCSFLLIGFWHRDSANGRAAKKAFIVTRIGDVALLLGIILIATGLGSASIAEASRRAASSWATGSIPAILAAALLLGGAVGKSAQLPLHTWLPDAMAGPSPVSALIHAATMVTAGVYLVARANAFFTLAPEVLLAVALIGAATLLVAGASALFQRDLKRILAYSTMSQIGYMFLALGTAAWTGGIFHLVTHALFKALLFLAAGAIINALGHERDVFRMGGLAKKMPLAFWTFLAGAFGLTALPPVTAGLASKDAIIAHLWFYDGVTRPLFWAAMVGVLLTSLYTFRMLFLVFSGPSRAGQGSHATVGSQAALGSQAARGLSTALPLVVLALLCLVAGLIDFPALLGGKPFFGLFLATALPATPHVDAGASTELFLGLAPLLTSIVAIPIAWLVARHALALEAKAAAARPLADTGAGYAGGFGTRLAAFIRGGFGFDRLYHLVFVKPILGMAGRGRDPVNGAAEGLRGLALGASGLLRLTQDGRPRRYLAILAAGAAILLVAALL